MFVPSRKHQQTANGALKKRIGRDWWNVRVLPPKILEKDTQTGYYPRIRVPKKNRGPVEYRGVAL